MNDDVLAVVVTTEPPSPSIIEPSTRSTSVNSYFAIVSKQELTLISTSSRVVSL